MRKGLLVSFIAASVLTMAQADKLERFNSGMMSGGMPEVEEHMADMTQKKDDMHKKEKKIEKVKDEARQPKELTPPTTFDDTPQPSQIQKSPALSMTQGVEEHQKEIEDELNEKKQNHFENVEKEAQGQFGKGNENRFDDIKKEVQNESGEGKENRFDNIHKEAQDKLSKGEQNHFEDMQEEIEDSLDKEHKKGKAHLSIVDLVEKKDGKTDEISQLNNLPKEVKELLHEVKKAVKLYKKEELFKEFNITDVTDLQDPQIKEEIQRLVEEAKKEREQEVSQKLIRKRVAEVAGEFIRIGDGQYDWVFVTKTGDVYKLAGVTQSGNFAYEKLPGVKGIMDENGKVKIVASQITNDIEAQIANKEFKGYPFAKYDDPNENGFDWIVVTGGKAYKLEGFDPEGGTFVYTPATGVNAVSKGDVVELLPGQEG